MESCLIGIDKYHNSSTLNRGSVTVQDVKDWSAQLSETSFSREYRVYVYSSNFINSFNKSIRQSWKNKTMASRLLVFNKSNKKFTM